MLLHQITEDKRNITAEWAQEEKDRFKKLMNTDRKDMSKEELEWYTTQLQKSNYNSETNSNEKR